MLGEPDEYEVEAEEAASAVETKGDFDIIGDDFFLFFLSNKFARKNERFGAFYQTSSLHGWLIAADEEEEEAYGSFNSTSS